MSSPIIIDIVGPRKSGKTTLINGLISNKFAKTTSDNLNSPIISSYLTSKNGQVYVIKEFNTPPSYCVGFGLENHLQANIIIMVTAADDELSDVNRKQLLKTISSVTNSVTHKKIPYLHLVSKSDMDIDPFDRNSNYVYFSTEDDPKIIWNTILDKIRI